MNGHSPTRLGRSLSQTAGGQYLFWLAPRSEKEILIGIAHNSLDCLTSYPQSSIIGSTIITSSEFFYVTYIRTTPEKLWSALTKAEFIKQYWFGMHCECAWKTGASWKMVFEDGRIADAGEIIEINPPKRLVFKWRNEWKPEMKAEGYSRCTFDLESMTGAVKITVTHAIDRDHSIFIEAVSGGWPQVLSNLKSLLETGTIALIEHGGH